MDPMIGAIRHPRTGSIGAPAGPAVAFAVLLVAVAPSAGAERPHCGSYASRPGDAAILEVLGLSSPPERPSDVGTGDRADRPRPTDRPCDGPGCSRGSAPRPAAPTAAGPPPLEHWACLGPGSLGGDPPPNAPPVTDQHARLAPVPPCIFHPPRVA